MRMGMLDLPNHQKIVDIFYECINGTIPMQPSSPQYPMCVSHQQSLFE